MREIRPQDLDVIVDEKRPVPLSHWVHCAGHGTFDAWNAGRIRKIEQKRAAEEEARARAGGLVGRGDAGDEWTRCATEAAGASNRRIPGRSSTNSRRGSRPAPRLLVLPQGLRAPRAAGRARSCASSSRAEEQRQTAERQEELASSSSSAVQPRGEVFRLEPGARAHHAGMLPIYKEVVERARAAS